MISTHEDLREKLNKAIDELEWIGKGMVDTECMEEYCRLTIKELKEDKK